MVTAVTNKASDVAREGTVDAGCGLRVDREAGHSSLGRRPLAELARAAETVKLGRCVTSGVASCTPSARACVSSHEQLSFEDAFGPCTLLIHLSNSCHPQGVHHIDSCSSNGVFNSCDRHGVVLNNAVSRGKRGEGVLWADQSR